MILIVRWQDIRSPVTFFQEYIKAVYCRPAYLTYAEYIMRCTCTYAEYIMRNAGLEEAQAGIKIARTNINNLRYADDTTLMAESEDELTSLLMKVKEESDVKLEDAGEVQLVAKDFKTQAKLFVKGNNHTAYLFKNMYNTEFHK